ncbi:RNB domain-containing protein [Apiospora sp. TS-2023a]
MAPSSYVKGVLQVLPHATRLDSTADYHSTLLDQTQTEARTRDADHQAASAAATAASAWMDTSNTRPWTAKRPGSSRSMKSFIKSTTRRSHEEPTPCPLPPDSIQPIGTIGAYGEMSSQELEVFKALPTTIQRKQVPTATVVRYSSSGLECNSSSNNNATTATTSNVAELFLLNEKAQPDQSGRAAGKQAYTRPSPLYQTATNAASVDRLPLNHPFLPRQDAPLTREEQVALAKQLRESVILDAAGEALSKTGHRLVRRFTPPVETPTLSSGRPSMDSRISDLQDPPAHHATARDSFYDSFRWLEEDEDLDLSLHIDDYHTKPSETMTTPPKERRPSFRRRMSIGKIPFGKTPGSSSRPSTRDMFRAPTFPMGAAAAAAAAAAAPDPLPQHQPGRRKSRALSLITPRHASHASVASLDSAAAHYQDPEARLKLRAYLSTPQKFDEAQSSKVDLRRKASDDSEKLKTFLSDDHSSIYSDDGSAADPDTPMTPHSPEKEKQLSKNGGSRLEAPQTSDSESSIRGPSVSREMTMRMTLTRPDLRAAEDHIYGWQRPVQTRAGRMSQSAPRGDGAACAADAKSKVDYEKFFSELDESATPAGEGGAMKRFWHRVTRN